MKYEFECSICMIKFPKVQKPLLMLCGHNACEDCQ